VEKTLDDGARTAEEGFPKLGVKLEDGDELGLEVDGIELDVRLALEVGLELNAVLGLDLGAEEGDEEDDEEGDVFKELDEDRIKDAKPEEPDDRLDKGCSGASVGDGLEDERRLEDTCIEDRSDENGAVKDAVVDDAPM